MASTATAETLLHQLIFDTRAQIHDLTRLLEACYYYTNVTLPCTSKMAHIAAPLHTLISLVVTV